VTAWSILKNARMVLKLYLFTANGITARQLRGINTYGRQNFMVKSHAALQRIVGGQLGQSRIPGHGAHVPCAGKAAHSPASDQVAALVVQLQDQRDLGVHCNKLPAATAHEALFQAVESKPKSILFCFSFKFKDFLSLDH